MHAPANQEERTSTRFIATKGDAGKRLDLWLCVKLKKTSRRQVKKMLDDGRVFLNGKRVVIAGWEVNAGDTAEIATAEHAHARARQRVAQHHLHIYFEDRDLIVVEKPAGLVTAASDEREGDGTLVDLVRGYLHRRFRKSAGSFVKPLHRLDRDTSGVVVFAKSKEGGKLDEQFRRHAIRRRYAAVVEGVVRQDAGIVDAPLEKGTFSGGRKVKIAKTGEGNSARTRFTIRERYSKITLLEIEVETGRTHQIRVHMASIGHPLVGDKLYGSHVKFSRHALHATLLEFRHHETRKKLEFQSPLPDDLRQLIDRLRRG